ncbi:MAG: hypothetical protein HYV26_12415 [Candidatus Hydrogenedentes bacterium]|nr:hypothetical protein [Candidatus Hydrogenedentota bacterium]MBI3117315.1 hypothetical protein [Candidatus Hydrogenedentota bacterium]
MSVSPFQTPQATREKILALGHLKAGWRFGEGDPASPEAFATALALLDTVVGRGFDETDAFPGVNGEVVLTVYFQDRCLEFVVAARNDIDVTWEVGGAVLRVEEGQSLEEARGAVENFWGELWKSFESFISANTTAAQASSAAPLSGPAVKSAGVVFRLLEANAYASSPAPPAPISEGSMS